VASTNSPLPITVIIPCYNEGHNIRAVLESVKWADEIMVVDSYSTDATLDIARKYTDFILQRNYIHSADQKNWAIPQATHQWILLVDADERVTPELRTEIQASLAAQPTETAFWIGRENYFMNKRVRYSGWQNDAVIRLFRRECRYENKAVHAEILASGKIGRLKHRLIHNTYKDIDHFLHKMTRYARLSAIDYADKTPRVTLYHLWLKPAFRFFKHYILKLGFLDGKVGFIISVIMAWGVFLRYVNIKARRENVEREK